MKLKIIETPPQHSSACNVQTIVYLWLQKEHETSLSVGLTLLVAILTVADWGLLKKVSYQGLMLLGAKQMTRWRKLRCPDVYIPPCPRLVHITKAGSDKCQVVVLKFDIVTVLVHKKATTVDIDKRFRSLFVECLVEEYQCQNWGSLVQWTWARPAPGGVKTSTICHIGGHWSLVKINLRWFYNEIHCHF